VGIKSAGRFVQLVNQIRRRSRTQPETICVLRRVVSYLRLGGSWQESGTLHVNSGCCTQQVGVDLTSRRASVRTAQLSGASTAAACAGPSWEQVAGEFAAFSLPFPATLTFKCRRTY